MDRSFYLRLAESGLRMPIGSDLVLREQPQAENILLDGARLGRVLQQAAQRYRSPLAFPVMDLMLEKADLLGLLGLGGANIDSWHFDACPTDDMLNTLEAALNAPLSPRMRANVDAIAWIAANTDLVPVGMSIGPFSLMTKLLSDPITPIYLAGTGVSGEDDEEVRTVERVLELSTRTVLRSVQAQIHAGAKAIFIAEPAASVAYLSPKQIQEGSDIFERYPMAHNRRVKQLMERHGVDLIFHCCGELIDPMVQAFASLDPAILSLGSSRKLWEDARLVPKTTVLYGNLPSKKFYSDDVITVEQVRALADELIANMKRVGHPFILGSECDVLHVPGCEHQIMKKVKVICQGH